MARRRTGRSSDYYNEELAGGKPGRHDGPDTNQLQDIDWNKAPIVQAEGSVTISGSSDPVLVKVSATKATAEQVRQAQECFGGLTGPIRVYRGSGGEERRGR